MMTLTDGQRRERLESLLRRIQARRRSSLSPAPPIRPATPATSNGERPDTRSYRPSSPTLEEKNEAPLQHAVALRPSIPPPPRPSLVAARPSSQPPIARPSSQPPIARPSSQPPPPPTVPRPSAIPSEFVRLRPSTLPPHAAVVQTTGAAAESAAPSFAQLIARSLGLRIRGGL